MMNQAFRSDHWKALIQKIKDETMHMLLVSRIIETSLRELSWECISRACSIDFHYTLYCAATSEVINQQAIRFFESKCYSILYCLTSRIQELHSSYRDSTSSSAGIITHLQGRGYCIFNCTLSSEWRFPQFKVAMMGIASSTASSLLQLKQPTGLPSSYNPLGVVPIYELPPEQLQGMLGVVI